MKNNIELKSVRELLGMKFFIPSYQRGYRWTEQQVKDLLDDVNDFEPQVTMFADANDKLRKPRHHSRGLRAPCREAPPRCFS